MKNSGFATHLAIVSLLIMSSCIGVGDEQDSHEETPEETSATSQADTAQGMVAGTGDVSDDFNDEGVVDFNTRNTSNAVGLWQAILWADGAIESNGSIFDEADIDCDFGPNTTAATRSWQSTHGVHVDGSAGPITFKRAGANLRLGPRVTPEGDHFFVDYVGSHHTFRLVRNVADATPPFQNAYFAFGTFFFFTYSPGPGCFSSDILSNILR
jgi:peptidoglycan hydrolase-like protein with peptidoglycan-binding domain